jgi:hypothetical protein
MRKPNAMSGRPGMVISLFMVLIGVAMIVRTLSGGGGVLATGLILGILFMLAGLGRLYIGRTTR